MDAVIGVFPHQSQKISISCAKDVQCLGCGHLSRSMSACICQQVYEPAGVLRCTPCKSMLIHAVHVKSMDKQQVTG